MIIKKPLVETEVFNHARVVGCSFIVHGPASSDELKLEAEDEEEEGNEKKEEKEYRMKEDD